MTKEEYTEGKKRIVETFGVPEYDNHAAVNESAKRCTKLLTEYRLSCRAKQLKEDKETDIRQKAELSELATQDVKRKYSVFDIPEICINENDLAPFDDVEIDVITNHFENMSLAHKQLAIKSNVSRQVVTALLSSPAYRLLEAKVFDKLMPTETRMALLRAVRGLDSKITQRMAEHYKILNPEKLEVDLNKPIDDPEALKLLKEIGDKLVDKANKKI